MGRFRVPSYCLHKGTGQAVVRIRGRHFYLGKFGSPGSREEYERLIRRHLELPSREPGSIVPDLTVNELLIRFWRHAERYYRRADGKPSGEIQPLAHALAFLRDEAGLMIAAEFSPLRLVAVRARMIAADLCRNVVNGHCGRVKRLFRWAVAQELIPASVLQALQAVDGLRRGRSEARETPRIRPVSIEDVAQTMPNLAPPVRAMVEVQRLSGMRPGEVCAMTTGALEIGAGAWLYRPVQHKGSHLGREKEIFLGPKAQAILRPFLQLDRDAPLFSPRDSQRYWGEKRRKRAPRRPPKAAPMRGPGRAYDVASYRRAIKYACAKAGLKPAWHPNQLRHARATELRGAYGLEAAMAALGHNRLETTQIYAEKSREAARKIAEETG